MTGIKKNIAVLYKKKDLLWFLLWLSGLFLIWSWNLLFLNTPAFYQLISGFINTIIVSFMVIIFSAFLGWSAILIDHWLTQHYPKGQIILIFFINLIRSIPQIVGILMGYVLLTILIQDQVLTGDVLILVAMALIIALFVFLEIFDLLKERIAHFRRLDFFNAMLVCGIKERYIINREIILRSSLLHVVNKLIALFGVAIFLLCSVDFIISVGLSTEISAVDLPITLGSLLAKIDSKQDILAIGHSLTHWDYIIRLPFEHLQGITVAFLIVFTLVCMYQITNGYTRRVHL